MVLWKDIKVYLDVDSYHYTLCFSDTDGRFLHDYSNEINIGNIIEVNNDSIDYLKMLYPHIPIDKYIETISREDEYLPDLIMILEANNYIWPDGFGNYGNTDPKSFIEDIRGIARYVREF